MALKDVQDKLTALIDEGEQIANKAELSKADMERLEIISVEGNALKSQIEALKKAGELGDWAKKSAGMLPIAGSGAMVHGFRHEGDVVVEDQNHKSVLVSVDGVPLIPEGKLKAIKSVEYKDAFHRYMRSAATGGQLMNDAAIKTLQEGLDVSGGFLAPEDIQNRVIQKEPTPTVLAGRVTRLTTSRDTMVFPQVTYTTNNQYTTPMRVTWTGEIPASATVHNVTDPTFGQVRIPIYTAMMSIPVTRDMIEDAAFDLMGWISSKFSETINLTYEDFIATGTGANRPSGITTNSTAQTNAVVSGNASLLTGDGLVNLAFNLPPQYDNNSVWAMTKTNAALAIFKLKDGDGRYLWSDNAEGGGLRVPKVRGDLLGYPLIYTELLPTIAANAYPIIFGDLSGYYLVQRVGFTIEVARELKIETNQVLVVGRIRVGGQLVEDWRLRLQKVSA